MGTLTGLGGSPGHRGAVAQPVVRVGLRHRLDERDGVGVQRVVEHLGRRPLLGDAAQVQDADAVREVARGGDVMRYVQERDAQPLLQLPHQVQDLRAAGGVDHGDRLVGQDVVGLHDERPGDAHALPLAPGQHVRELDRELAGGGEPHLLQRLLDAVGLVLDPVDEQRLLQHLAHVHEGVDAGVGVLEDRLGAAAEPSQLALGRLRQVDAVEHDAPLGDGRQPQRGPAQRRLAAAGLADDGHRLAALQRQRHAVDGAHGVRAEEHLPGGEVHLDAVHGQEWRQRYLLLQAAVVRVWDAALPLYANARPAPSSRMQAPSCEAGGRRNDWRRCMVLQ